MVQSFFRRLKTVFFYTIQKDSNYLSGEIKILKLLHHPVLSCNRCQTIFKQLFFSAIIIDFQIVWFKKIISSNTLLERETEAKSNNPSFTNLYYLVDVPIIY